MAIAVTAAPQGEDAGGDAGSLGEVRMLVPSLSARATRPPSRPLVNGVLLFSSTQLSPLLMATLQPCAAGPGAGGQERAGDSD